MKFIQKPRALTWMEVARKALRRAADDMTGRAAQLAYYFFLSIFPMMICGFAILGIFAAHAVNFRAEIFQFLARIAPSSNLLQHTIDQVTKSSGSGKLSIGLVVTLWSASSGISAIMDTVNAQYGVKETRSFFKRTLIAVGLTIAAGILVLLAIAIALIPASEIALISVGGLIPLLWEVLRWPVALCFVLVAFELIYYFTANKKDIEWQLDYIRGSRRAVFVDSCVRWASHLPALLQ